MEKESLLSDASATAEPQYDGFNLTDNSPHWETRIAADSIHVGTIPRRIGSTVKNARSHIATG
jgi:hypothetical protein